MYEDYLNEVDSFLKQNGAKTIPTSLKDKRKLLVSLVDYDSVTLDCIDSNSNNYSNIDDYINSIENIRINIVNTKGYIIGIKTIEKETRKLKRKENMQKVRKLIFRK